MGVGEAGCLYRSDNLGLSFLLLVLCGIVDAIMARHKRIDDFRFDEDEVQEFVGIDNADDAFWDEFARLEEERDEIAPLVSITIRNEETGEERVIENVRLRFRALKKLFS